MYVIPQLQYGVLASKQDPEMCVFHTATAMPQSNITDPNTKRQAARDVLDILSEISTLLVCNPLPPPPTMTLNSRLK